MEKELKIPEFVSFVSSGSRSNIWIPLKTRSEDCEKEKASEWERKTRNREKVEEEDLEFGIQSLVFGQGKELLGR